MATIVAFHAHPDDEVLLTGGTIAWLAAEGHRVIIVAATNGEIWPGQHRGQRLDELRASAAILGADKAVHLGYAGSGAGPVLFEDPPGSTRFARADVEEAARKLASLLADEHADLLLSYDPQGGYGHPDHVRVHQVGAQAARLAGVRVVEATVPRELIARFGRLLLMLRLVTRHRLDRMRGYGMPQSAITHRVDVRRYAAQKRAGLAAHKTDVFSRGRTARLFRALVRSPLPMFRIACGTEWFAEPGGRTGELVARGQTTRASPTGISAQHQPSLTNNPQVSAICQPPTPYPGPSQVNRSLAHWYMKRYDDSLADFNQLHFRHAGSSAAASTVVAQWG